LIKLEDHQNHHQHHHQNHHHQPMSIYEHEKSMQTASMATAVQTPADLSSQFFYQHPGLIQIAPQPAHQASSVQTMMESAECRHQMSPPPLQLTTSSHSTHSNDI
jgi:G3E family GTPase